jgi:hypothetical protein
VRREATRELERLGELSGPQLHQALEGKQPLEARQRIEHLPIRVESRRRFPPAEQLRILRVLAVLERIGTPEARDVLAKLARRAPEARLTQEEGRHGRLARRAAVTP